MRAHTLRVDTGCWQIHNRLCDICDLDDVQGEKHVLFLMPLLSYLRRRFEEQFADCTGRTFIGGTGAFYFDNIVAEDSSIRCEIVSLEADIQIIPFFFLRLRIFLSGWQSHGVQQALQSIHLAEGLTPLQPNYCYSIANQQKAIREKVSKLIWRGGNGHCDKCPYAAVQNEVHVFFHYQDCSLRR